MLFQVHFLSLLLEERGAGVLADVAEHCRQKLIRRHPHVFGDAEADTAGEVLRNWDAIKQTEEGREPGIFGEVPENLPGPLHARKVQRRAASTGFDFAGRPVRRESRQSSRSCEAGRQTASSASTRSATCCSRRSTSPASSRSTPSSRCAPRRSASAAASRPPSAWPRPTARTGTDLGPTSSSATTHRRG